MNYFWKLVGAEQRIAELVEENRRLREALEWQPIETAPKDGACLLVTGWDRNEIGGSRHFAVGYWSDLYDMWIEDTKAEHPLSYLTHWRPLPDPPQESKQ